MVRGGCRGCGAAWRGRDARIAARRYPRVHTHAVRGGRTFDGPRTGCGEPRRHSALLCAASAAALTAASAAPVPVLRRNLRPPRRGRRRLRGSDEPAPSWLLLSGIVAETGRCRTERTGRIGSSVSSLGRYLAPQKRRIPAAHTVFNNPSPTVGRYWEAAGARGGRRGCGAAWTGWEAPHWPRRCPRTTSPSGPAAPPPPRERATSAEAILPRCT